MLFVTSANKYKHRQVPSLFSIQSGLKYEHSKCQLLVLFALARGEADDHLLHRTKEIVHFNTEQSRKSIQ